MAKGALNNAYGRSTVILAVLADASANLPGSPWASTPGTLTVEFSALTPAMLQKLEPDVVVTGLLSRGFDCTDVARILSDAEFSGEFRVLCAPLPKPEIVARELRSTYPTLDLDLWVLP